jgi:hypothetical protein
VIDAIDADGVFDGFTRVISSAQADASMLPCWSVSAPNERKRHQTRTTSERTTQVVVACSVEGGSAEIEDDLDVLSARVEVLILAALNGMPVVARADLIETAIKTGQPGARIVGTLHLLFEVKSNLYEPLRGITDD